MIHSQELYSPTDRKIKVKFLISFKKKGALLKILKGFLPTKCCLMLQKMKSTNLNILLIYEHLFSASNLLNDLWVIIHRF
jgi:hypothetical protein